MNWQLRDGQEGMAAELVARVATAPRARFFPSGELVWEFNLRLVMDAHVETLTVRAPDEHYSQLQNWAIPGRLMYIRGWLHLIRWVADGRDKARLVMDPLELMPLGMNIQGSAPAAMDYSNAAKPAPPATPEVQAQQPVETNKARRAARARQLLEEAENDAVGS
jgi:single-stranded DNA-binding protein